MASSETLPDDAVDVHEELPADAVEVTAASAPTAPAKSPGVWDSIKSVGNAALGELTGENNSDTELRSALGGFSNAIGLNAGRMVDSIEGAFPALKKTPEELISGVPAANVTPNKEAFAQAAEKAPLANLAGSVAAPNPLGKVGAIGKGVKGLGGVALRAGARGVEGAGLAGLAGFGASNKDTLGGQLGDALDSAKFGGGLGSTASLAGAIASKLGQRLTQKTAPGLAVKSVTHAGIGDKLASKGIDTEAKRTALGRFMLDNDMVGAFRKPDYTLNKANAAMSKSGGEIGDILDQANAAGRFKPALAAQAARKSLEGGGLLPHEVDASKKAMQAIDQISRLEPDFQKARALKSGMYDAVNWKDEAPLAQQLHKRVALGLRDNIGDQVSEALGPDAAAKLEAANKLFGNSKKVAGLAEDEASRLSQHKPFSLTGHGLSGVAGLVGAGSHGATGGLGAALGTEVLSALMNGRTASTAARAADLAGKGLGWAPEKASIPGGMSRASEALRQAIERYLDDNNKPQGEP